MLNNYGHIVKYIADIKAYNTGEYDWDAMLEGEIEFEEIDDVEIKRSVVTNEDDGSYTMYILPGTYDVLMERLGFLPEAVINITVNESDVINLGNRILTEGNSARDAVISGLDLVRVTDTLDAIEDDGVYLPQCDFGQKGFISGYDLVSITNNFDQIMNVEKYM